MSMREVAQAAQVSYADTKRTLSRCVQARQLVEVGREKREHSTSWIRLYDVAPPPPEIEPRHGHGMVDIQRIIAGWAR